MKGLNRKQKNMLRRYVKEEFFTLSIIPPMFYNCNADMPEDLYWEVFKMNPHEYFDGNVNRFISDINSIDDCKVI
ncbi:MAG: hypothetical protein GY718_10700 [Lentisphaerae bacterium]|nr:hypothetical protein [Lentisphaerota bacterium]